MDKLELSKLSGWLNKIGANGVIDLFERLLEHQNARIREGAIALAEHLAISHTADIIIINRTYAVGLNNLPGSWY